MYSPLGLVIFVAVEGTFVRFTKVHDHFISNCIRCGCLRQYQCNVACLESCIKQKCTGNWPSPLCARRQRIAPFDLRRASLPVSAAISIMFLDSLCSKRWYDVPHIGVVFIRFRGPRFPLLVDIRLVTINRHARCSL